MHQITNRKIVLVALLAVVFAPAFVPGNGGAGLYIAFTVFIGALWIIVWRHSRLRPWCPWCNWGKGGDEEVSPEVPDPALSK